MEKTTDIAKNLQRIIEARGLKVRDAGRLCGYQTDTEYRNFYNYYKGTRNPDAPSLIKIASGLSVSVEEILLPDGGVSNSGDVTKLNKFSLAQPSEPDNLSGLNNLRDQISICIGTYLYINELADEVTTEQYDAMVDIYTQHILRQRKANQEAEINLQNAGNVVKFYLRK